MGSFRSNNNDRSIPMVEFNNCLELEMILSDWLSNNRTLQENTGLLLYKLGLVSDGLDKVLIFNYNKGDNSFICMINSEEYYYIKLKNLNLDGFNPEIEVRKGNQRYVYECISIPNIELGMRIYMKEYCIYENKICFTRSLSMDSVVFNIDYGKYILEFGVSKPNDLNVSLFDGLGNYSYYSLENEEELMRYFKSLKFPVSIIDIYKRICEISLGDVNKYPRILLKIYKRDKYLNKRVVDLVHLSYGNLLEFGMTIKNRNRTLFLNSDDSWSYEMISDECSVKISGGDDTGRVNYDISVSNIESLDGIKDILESNRNNVNQDVRSIKILTKKVFDRKSNYEDEE